MSTGAWATAGIALTVFGTLVAALLTRRAQHESTRVSDAANLLHSQIEFIDRQSKQLDSAETALTACRAVISRQEEELDRCRERSARLDDALATMRSVVVEQITAAATASGLEPGASHDDEEAELAAVRQFLEHMREIPDPKEAS